MEKWFFEENEKTSFEIDASDSKRIIQTLVSFANHKGGSILFGVNSKSKIVGCYPESVIEELNQLIKLYCLNVISRNPKTHEFQNKRIVEFEIEVADAPARITKMNSLDGYYIRCHINNVKAGKIITHFFQLLSRKTTQQQVNPELSNELQQIIKQNGSLTLAQLYKISTRTKKEIDTALPALLIGNGIQFELRDKITYFY